MYDYAICYTDGCHFEEIKGMQDKDETRKFEEFRICPKLNEKK